MAARPIWRGQLRLAPDAKAGEDVYAVLRDAIAKAGSIALTRVVISQRERMVALRDAGPGIIAHTLLEERDLNRAGQYFDEAAKLPVDPEMVDLATQLIKRQAGKYDPADIEDRYENRLRAMIDAKVAGMPLEPEERVYDRNNVIDLVSLKKSLEEANTAEAGGRKQLPAQGEGQKPPEKAPELPTPKREPPEPSTPKQEPPEPSAPKTEPPEPPILPKREPTREDPRQA